jgi:hypothetical protein
LLACVAAVVPYCARVTVRVCSVGLLTTVFVTFISSASMRMLYVATPVGAIGHSPVTCSCRLVAPALIAATR